MFTCCPEYIEIAVQAGVDVLFLSTMKMRA